MTSPTNTGPDHAASIGNTVRDIVEHDPGRIDEAWCYKLIRQLLRSIDMQTAMGMPHRAITPDTVAIHDNGAPLLLPLLLSDVRPAVEEDLHALASLIHYAITRELLPQGPLRGRDLPGYGEPLLTAIDRCMSPDPGERPHDIGKLRELLGIAAVETPAPPPPPAGLDLPGLDLDAIDPADLGPIPDDAPAPAEAVQPDPAAQLDAIIAELDAAADPDDGAARPDAPAQESDASARTGMAQVADPAPAPVPVPDTAPPADAARSGDTAPPAVPAQLIKPAQAGPAADAPSVPAADAASARPAASTDDGPVPQPLRPSSPAPLETAAVIPPLSASASPSVAVGIPPPPLQAGKANAGRTPQAQRRPWGLAVGAVALVAIVLAGYLGWRGKGPSTPAGRAPAPVEDAGTVPGTGTPAASVPAAGMPDIGASATGSAGTGTDQAPSAAPSAAPPTTSASTVASTVAQGGAATATAPATPAAAAGQPASGNMTATPTPFPAPATAKAPMPLPPQPGAPRNPGSANPALAPAAAPERPAAASSTAQPASEAPVPNGAAAYRLQIQPWGVVYVDGAERGVSPPLKRLTLAPGRHAIRIANPNFQERALEVDTAEGDGRITVDFAAE